MQIHQRSDHQQEFLSCAYRGRAIAAFNHYGRWHVYLDHVLQNNVVFATAEQAIAWLSQRVDQGMPARFH